MDGASAGQSRGQWSKYQRNLVSYHKNHLFVTYGGVLWATLLACLGYTDRDIVAVVNSFVSQRVEAAGREPVAVGDVRGPRLSRRALAATQGEDMPAIRGVWHTVSEGKKAREAAKGMARQSDLHSQRWWDAFNKGLTRRGDWWEAEAQRLRCDQNERTIWGGVLCFFCCETLQSPAATRRVTSGFGSWDSTLQRC